MTQQYIGDVGQQVEVAVSNVVDPLNTAIAAINYANTDEVSAAKARALLRGYDAKWSGFDYVPVEVEMTATSPLYNPKTEARSRRLSVAGKLDVVADYFGKRVLIDHKTTSEDITDPNAPYWRQLSVDSQASHYMLLKWLNGEKLDEAVWDVIRKPTISPKQLKSKAEHAAIVSRREYFGQRLSRVTMDWLQTNAAEDTAMYEARLAHDCTLERPDWYFARRPVPRLDAELAEYASDLWDAGQLVLEARRNHRWPRHPASCMAYGTPCTFLGICSGFDTADSANWIAREEIHKELPDLPVNTKDVLTFTSIRTFQTCPRKFYYRYELGIKRIDEVESEAIRFGSLLHLGLEAYWRALMPAENHHGDAHVAGNDTASDAPLPF